MASDFEDSDAISTQYNANSLEKARDYFSKEYNVIQSHLQASQ